MFLDEVTFSVAAGSGGAGVVHFRREKYIPRGGPDGGDGGKGGDAVLVCSKTHSTLSSFRHKPRFAAEDGRPGGRSNRTGRSGDDQLIPVPAGTIVHDDELSQRLGELIEVGDRLVVGRGGRGGRGNARYANSRNQAPRMAEKGEPGEKRRLRLELRLIADVGIVGAPNAGKSTLLAAITNARPKIADYPFTTLDPQLGVAELDDETAIVLADIPGLIEGAHTGAGLGTGFLKHISRTRGLIHLLDGMAEEPLIEFSQVNAELELFDPQLARKPQVVALNKFDLPQVKARWPELEASFKALGVQVRPVSALARQGLRELVLEAYRLAQTTEPEPEEGLPIYRPEPNGEQYQISREPDGSWRIEGTAIERAAEMTYWQYEEAVRRFQRMLTRIGVTESLRAAGAKAGDTVHIGDHELEWRE
ncbi:MAG: GTPase ObgE [Anaerolineales bacterium]